MAESSATVHSSSSGRVFNQPDPETIYLGQTSLKDYLKSAKITAPLVIRDLLLQQDWQSLESLYAPTGRPPFAPVAMMGLILYGIHKGISSLRRLEEFARADFGCLWVTGGIAPDHSVIGKFICRHHEQITSGLFTDITTSIIQRTGGQGDSIAGDGTVIEAAFSHYGLLKQEAVEQAHKAARQAAERKPDDPATQARLLQTQKTAEVMNTRVQNKKAKGKKTDKLCISAQEPDAMMQRQKRGRGSAPSYKPSVLVNDQRLILGQAVHASPETSIIPQMLDQSEAICGTGVREQLLDAGYCSHDVIAETLARDIRLLCPEGRVPGEGKSSDTKYHKGQFTYGPQHDCYVCPANQRLGLMSWYKGNDKAAAYQLYGTKMCTDCTLRDKCTTAKFGRRVKRYPEDEAKEALRQVMGHKAAKQRFGSRQAWVEPVFSVLRGNQGLNRFRGKGLASVQTEFGLHVLAYNLGRLLAFLYAECDCLLSNIKPFWRSLWGSNRSLALEHNM
ncbi:MAG: transposase [Arenicella sp.]|jgi:transposase